MDYFMVQKGNLPNFESSNISETEEAMPTKNGVYACYINTYLHDFFEPILSNKIFWWQGKNGRFWK